MTAGPRGTVMLCQHGNRRIVRVAGNLTTELVVDRFEGKRLNSPNDVVFRSDGGLYFSDPPSGLPRGDADPMKELRFNGLYRFADGALSLLTDTLTRPNGLAFSPDERILYVANSDVNRRLWMRYDVRDDGSLAKGDVFVDVTSHPEAGLPDGMKLDASGNIFATGPGGISDLQPGGYTSGRSGRRSSRRIWRGAAMEQRCSSPRCRASIVCARQRAGNGLSTERQCRRTY